MFLLLTLAIATSSPAQPALVPQDPPIRITLSDDHVRRGDRVKVKVKVALDGYLVVLRLDADGRTRMVFPVDPGDNTAIRGGHDMEIQGRGGRESFLVDESQGVGTVLAAWSAAPFQLDQFVRHGHWDYAALAVPRDSTPGGGEPALLDLIEKMTGQNQHYDYDVVTYGVGVSPRYTSRGYDPYDYYGGWHARGFYGGCFDWDCDPWYYPRVGFGFRTTIFLGRPRYYRPTIGVRVGGRRRW